MRAAIQLAVGQKWSGEDNFHRTLLIVNDDVLYYDDSTKHTYLCTVGHLKSWLSQKRAKVSYVLPKEEVEALFQQCLDTATHGPLHDMRVNTLLRKVLWYLELGRGNKEEILTSIKKEIYRDDEEDEEES